MLSISEFYEYLAFYSMNPSTNDRLDILFADLQALLANVHTDKNTKFTHKDFLREWGNSKKEKVTGKQIGVKLEATAKAMGILSVREMLAKQELTN